MASLTLTGVHLIGSNVGVSYNIFCFGLKLNVYQPKKLAGCQKKTFLTVAPTTSLSLFLNSLRAE
jgi:hypothetical protein